MESSISEIPNRIILKIIRTPIKTFSAAVTGAKTPNTSMKTPVNANKREFDQVSPAKAGLSPANKVPRESSPQAPKQHTKPTNPFWFTILLCLIGDRKMSSKEETEAAVAFVNYMGGPQFCKSNGKKFNFQIRTDMKVKAENFRFGANETLISIPKHYSKKTAPIVTGPKQNAKRTANYEKPARTGTSKGFINVANKTWSTIESCKYYLNVDTNNISQISKIIKDQSTNLIKLTFNTQAMPLFITASDNIRYMVTPALFNTIRCNKCQKFGHSTGICRATETVCPHCAGNHGHADCKNKQLKKCANCHGNHGVAYKGCAAYAKYASFIATKNNELTKSHQTKSVNSQTMQCSKDQVQSVIIRVLSELGQTPPANLEQIIEQELGGATLQGVTESQAHKSQVTEETIPTITVTEAPVTPETIPAKSNTPTPSQPPKSQIPKPSQKNQAKQVKTCRSAKTTTQVDQAVKTTGN